MHTSAVVPRVFPAYASQRNKLSASRYPLPLRQLGSSRTRAQRFLVAVRAAAAGSVDTYFTSSGLPDYDELLGVDDDATALDIKAAYRGLAKQCHPDLLGDDGHEICIVLNEAYATLSDGKQRARYNMLLDEALREDKDDYTGEPLSKWLVGHKMGKSADPLERRAVFVDEVQCIGCKQCVWEAPGVFRMEQQHGRSRVFAQWADTEDRIENAIQACPVSCIHWVDRDELPGLEYVMQHKTGRLGVGIMLGSGGAVDDVFSATQRFLKLRKELQEKRAVRAAQQSAAQREAQRRAAEALQRQQGGWMSGFGDMLASFLQQATGAAFQQDGEEEGVVVGRRRRAGRREAARLQGTIPLERSLVPASFSAANYLISE